MDKKYYVLETTVFFVFAVITALAPKILSGFAPAEATLHYVVICSWIARIVFALVALYFAINGIRNYFLEKKKQRRLVVGARA